MILAMAKHGLKTDGLTKMFAVQDFMTGISVKGHIAIQ